MAQPPVGPVSRAAIAAPLDDLPAPIINFLRDHAIEIPVGDGLAAVENNFVDSQRFRLLLIKNPVWWYLKLLDQVVHCRFTAVSYQVCTWSCRGGTAQK